MPFKRGLIVGKFSPLHLGHEFLIQQAESECDELVLLSWSKPEFSGCDGTRRRTWLQKRFPHLRSLVLCENELRQLAARSRVQAPALPGNDAPEQEARRFVAWVCLNVLEFEPDVVFTSEDYGDGFAAALTQYFSTAKQQTITVRHRCVDKARNQVPISGTALRENVHAFRRFLSPEIYADFVERIVLLGGESTGKTTLAKHLAAALNTQWVPEYGRELWEQRNGTLTYADMLDIATTQITRETQLAKTANQFLICDSSPLTTYFYSLEMFGRADKALEALANRPYAKVFLCEADFNFVQDGTRRGDDFRHSQQHWYREQLAAREISYAVLRGSIENRVQQVQTVLAAAATPAALV